MSGGKTIGAQDAAEFGDLAPTYLITSSLAIVLSLVSLGMAKRYSQLRRHPSSIILWNIVCDLFFAIKFFTTATVWFVRRDARDRLSSESFHFIPDHCTSAAIWGTFFGISSGSWNFIWVLNFFLEVKNPFKSTKPLMKYYHLYVWASTLVGIGILVAENNYTVSGDLTCWVPLASLVAWYADLLGIGCGLFGVYSLFFLLSRMRSSLEFSREARLRTLRWHAAYVAIFVLLWIPPLTWRHVDNIWGDGSQPLALRQSLAFFYCGQSVFICLVRFAEPQVRVLLFPCCFRAGSSELMAGGESVQGAGAASVVATQGPALLESAPLLGTYPALAKTSSWRVSSLAGGDVSGSEIGSSTVPLAVAPNTAADASAWGVGEHMRAELVMCLLSGLTQNLFDARTLTLDSLNIEQLEAASNKASRVSFSFALRENRSSDAVAGSFVDELSPLERARAAAASCDDSEPLGETLSASVSSPTRGELNDANAGAYAGARGHAASSSVGDRHSESTAGGGRATAQLDDSAGSLKRRRRVRHFITSYASEAFELVRARYSVSALDLANTLSPDLFAAGVIAAKFSDAKSGSFFCFSSDRRVILKTMPVDEISVVLELLPRYVMHLRAFPDSLICPIFGCFSFEAMGAQKVHCVLMGNVLGSYPFDAVYDLKGSTVKRTAYSGQGPRPSMLMDGDFARRGRGLRVTRDFRVAFLAQLQRDAALLESHSLMDYSLLVGVGPLDDDAERVLLADEELDGTVPTAPDSLAGLRTRAVFATADGEEVFMFGLIDLLQRYNTRKKLERGLKQVRHANRNVDISSLPPKQYAERLLAYVRTLLQVVDDEHSVRRTPEELLRRRAVSR